MWPSFIFWEEEDIVLQTGRFLGMNELEVKKDSDHFIFKAESENGDRPYLELVRTPYGFAGQTYTGGLSMLDYLYLISISGDTGIIGIVPDSPSPDPLTGQKDFDFPKTAPEWHHYDHGRLTGVGRDGDSFDLKDSD